ncbi:MAG: hypothetical protein EBS78_11405 [Altererythrobacter sp.]|nr:hypothetical protein [Altererythrobacter sp.]
MSWSTRDSPVSDRSFVICSVAAVGSVFAAAMAAATFVNAGSGWKGQATSDLKLGNLVSVEDWKYNGSGFAGGSCTIDGTAKYKVQGPEGLTGEVYGQIFFDHETEQASGWIVDGKGEIQVDLYRSNEAACAVKRSSQLEVRKTKLIVLPAVVQTEAD